MSTECDLVLVISVDPSKAIEKRRIIHLSDQLALLFLCYGKNNIFYGLGTNIMGRYVKSFSEAKMNSMKLN